jgi:hypothetical protein
MGSQENQKVKSQARGVGTRRPIR